MQDHDETMAAMESAFSNPPTIAPERPLISDYGLARLTQLILLIAGTSTMRRSNKMRSSGIAKAKAFLCQFSDVSGAFVDGAVFALAIHARISCSITGNAEDAITSR